MATVKIYATKDTYINEASPSTNYGSATLLKVSGKDANRCKAFMYFVLDQIKYKKVTAATLYYHVEGVGAGNDLHYKIGAVRAPWEENALTYANGNGIEYSYIGEELIASGEKIDVTKNVLSYIQSIAQGAKDYGIVIYPYISYGSFDYAAINSREASANKPYVEITYEDATPQAPTELAPQGNTNIAQVIRFSWKYNTEVGDKQTKFDLQWSNDNGVTWDTITQTTSNNYYDMPANTLSKGNIIWRVRTYNYYSVVSSYSEQVALTAYGTPTSATITSGATSATSRPVLAWTTPETQTAYTISVLDGVNTIWSSGEVLDTEKSATIGTDLENGKTYTIKLRYKNEYGLWSDWVTQSLTVNYPLPAVPAITLYKDVEKAAIRIEISNPDTGDTFLSNDLYKRKVGQEWERIATNLAKSSTCTDYFLENEVYYEYKVRTYGVSGGYKDSNIITTDITICGTILTKLDTLETITLKYNIERKDIYGKEKYYSKFAGRAKPVKEVGEHIDREVMVEATLKTRDEVDKIIELNDSGVYLLYRDNKGRYMICDIGKIEVGELQIGWWRIQFTLTEVSHDEVV